MAERSGLGVFLDYVLGALSSFTGVIRPYGDYSGASRQIVSSSNTVITNPWGVSAHYLKDARDPDIPSSLRKQPNIDIYLKPGQSYNFLTGQYNDPSIHEKTAARLNEQVNQRKVQEAGLDQASQTSARSGKSILATIDELYWGDTRTSASAGKKLGLEDEAKQVGINTTGTRTILGDGYNPKGSVTVSVPERKRIVG